MPAAFGVGVMHGAKPAFHAAQTRNTHEDRLGSRPDNQRLCGASGVMFESSFAQKQSSLSAGRFSAKGQNTDFLKRYCVKGTSGKIRSEFPSMNPKRTISGTLWKEGMRSEKLTENGCETSGKRPATMICFHLRVLKPVERVCITAGKDAHLQQEQCCLRREHS